MYNRFSSNANSKQGFDHSMISSVQSSNAVPIWEILQISEKEYNEKYNPLLPVPVPLPISHASPT